MTQNWLLDTGFKWQEITFSDKNRVKSRNPCYFLSKKSVLIETVLSKDPLYYDIDKKNQIYIKLKSWDLEVKRQSYKKIPSWLLCAVLMNGEVGWAVIAQIVKVAHQPLHSSIRVNWEFSSNCGLLRGLLEGFFCIIYQ